MTAILLLGGHWEYQFEDETTTTTFPTQPGTRMLNYVSGPVRTTNEVYSALAAAADEFQAMGFKNPMLPVTPNAYTMENQAFISRASTEKLKEGTITANWSLVGSAGDNSGRGVLRKEYSGGTAFVAGDIGRRILESVSGDTGTLLDFEVEPDGTQVAWIRPEDSTPGTGDTFDSTTGTISVVADGGTGAPNVTVAATSGISQYTAIQAIGSVPTATEVYIVQDRFKLANSASDIGFQFWSTDTGVSLGIISVLIRTQNAGVIIADGDLEVFARRYTSLYDNFRLNVAAGGFSALPLASAPDINNTTGYRQTTGSAGVNTFDVGNAIYVGATFATATKRGVITNVAGSVAAPVIDYYLIGDLTDFIATDAIKEYDFVAAVDGDATCTAGAPIAAPGGPTETGSGNGGTVTITLGTTTRDHDNDSVAEPYSVIVDALSNVPIAKVYERVKYVTRRGATTADLFGAGVNVPGETYRGIDAQVQYDAPVGIFGEGEDVDVLATGWTARSVSVNTTDTYVMLMDQQTSLTPLADNDVIRDEALDTVTVMGAPDFFTSPKSSPFGTFTGTQIFGARGVDFRNPAGADTQAYILTDDNGVLRTPPNTISYTIANLIAGDRVLVARDAGTSGVIDKDQFGGSNAANLLGDVTFECAGTVDSEVPQSGVIRVVENALQEEHRYEYSSRTTGAGGIFTLYAPTSATGTVTSASTTQIIDTGQLFSTGGNPVKIGHLVRNTFAGKTTHVWEVVTVDSDTTLTVKALYGPLDATQDWDIGDTYEINRLIQNYATSDDVFDTIIDREAIGVSEQNTFVKAGGSFGSVVQVRRGKSILPFEQNQSVGQVNVSVTTVRTPDTIAV